MVFGVIPQRPAMRQSEVYSDERGNFMHGASYHHNGLKPWTKKQEFGQTTTRIACAYTKF